MARICILGGTGFVGQALAAELAGRGHRLTVLTRRRRDHRALLVLPELRLEEIDVYRDQALAEHAAEADALINLVGILNEGARHEETFQRAHVELAQKLIHACRQNGVRRLLQMSALGADRAARSQYLRSKGEAERLMLDAGERLRVTCFRPSVIFGPGDRFFFRFAGLLRFAPYFFPLACAGTRFAPVYVGDVAARMAASLDDPADYGRAVDLCGPEVYTLGELVQLAARWSGRRRRVVGLPPALSRLQARVCERLPGRPFTMNNYHSLQVDSVCADGPPCPTRIEPVMAPLLAQA